MSRRITSLTCLLMAALILAGCQCKTNQELAEVPPPIMDQPESGQVEFTTPEPEPVDQAELEQTGVIQPATQQVIPVNAEPVRFSQSYTIRKGDTLWSIAREYYGDGKRWREIVEANPHIVPEKLRVGQVIILP